MTPQPRISAGAAALGLAVVRPDAGRYYLHEAFTTHRGSWELNSSDPFAVPAWARQKYLSAAFDDAGGDHHLFARVEDPYGQPIPTMVEYRAGDLYELKDTGSKRSGWANIPIWSAGWQWGPIDCAQAAGGQRPWEHVSTFAVWRMRPDPIPTPEPTPSKHWYIVLDVEQTDTGLTVANTTVTAML